MVLHVHPDCINANNPYHECTDYCFRKIAERKGTVRIAAPSKDTALSQLPTSFGRPREDFKRRRGGNDNDGGDVDRRDATSAGKPKDSLEDDLAVALPAARAAGGRGREGQRGREPEAIKEEEAPEVDDVPTYEGMDDRQKKLFEIRMKLNQARRANQTAVVAEKRREEQPEEEASRGVSKAAWFEEKKRKMGKQLEAGGLDMSKAYLLETQEAAEDKYKKWEKKPAPFGWDVFNQQSLYNAYKKRTDNIPYTEEDYLKARDEDPDFYRDGASLQYGKTPVLPEANVDRMVAELTGRAASRKEFSRRRRFHDEKDVDSINDRNEHFNRKIERAFGKYTVEIRNNLERGTALPD